MTEVDDKDDIALSAYIDGELPDEESRVLEQRLSNEPALARRLERLRGTDSDAQRVFAAIGERPMPQGVLDLLAEESPETEAGKDAETSNIVAFPQRGIKQYFQAPVAVAASVALLAGFLFGGVFQAGKQTPVEPAGLYAGQIRSDGKLHLLLEEGRSAETALLEEGRVAELMLTFQDRDGDYCRQLRVDGGGAPLQGVACRRGATWQVEAIGIAGKRSPDGSYQLAGGDTPAAIDSAIDELIGSLPPLDSDEENALISNAWKKSGD